jgi:hypothetical protein
MSRVEELRKEIFQCRLNGTPIVLDMLTCMDAEKHEIRCLLWEAGIIKLVKEDFFDSFVNRTDHAKCVYTHDLVVRNEYSKSDFIPAGRTLGVTYGAYKLLNPGKVT